MSVQHDTDKILTLMQDRGKITYHDIREAGIHTKNPSTLISRLEARGITIQRRNISGQTRTVEYSLAGFKRPGRIAG